jgi:four helix bundle protein
MPSEFRTKNLAIEFAKHCLKLNVSAALKDQLHRAAYSIPMNLNEGAARHTPKDRHKFYRIALGSFREVEIILEISEIKYEQIGTLRSQLGGSLVKLCKATDTFKP